MGKIDLEDMIAGLALEQGRREMVSLGQIREIIAMLGRRWRRIGWRQAGREMMAIWRRAGRNVRQTDMSRVRMPRGGR